MPITALPTPPTRSDPVNFSARADAFMTALPTFATEANALQTDVNAKQTAATTAANNAAASELAANASSNAAVWVSGTTYAVGNVRYSPITYLSYRRKTAGAGTTDPSADSTNWQLINGTGNVDLTSTQTLTNKTLSTGSVWNGSAVPIANGGTGQTTAANAFNALKQNATESATGVVELATTAEVKEGLSSVLVPSVKSMRQGLIVQGISIITNNESIFDIANIPSWVKRITIVFEEISTNATSPIIVRVGDSTSLFTSGYATSGVNIIGTGLSSSLVTTGFQIGSNTHSASNYLSGTMTLIKSTNSGSLNSVTGVGIFALTDTSGIKFSSGVTGIFTNELFQLRITTVGGTSTFDAGGSIHIMWE